MGRNATNGLAEQGMTVRFQHEKPMLTAVHDEVFRCPVEFSAERNEILFDPELLKFKMRADVQSIKALVRLYMSSRMTRLPVYDQSMTATVMLAIPSVMGTGKCDLEFVALALDLNSKRLQRLLAAEGTTFSVLIDKVRETMARRLLVDSDIPIERLAGLLDYASTGPFTSAFKRWTGLAPLGFRKRERARERTTP